MSWCLERDGDVWILRHDDPEKEVFRFNRTDLPDTLELLNFKCLPIVTYMGSDLAYLMMVSGRENHSGSKCIKCNANVSAFGREWICAEE